MLPPVVYLINIVTELCICISRTLVFFLVSYSTCFAPLCYITAFSLLVAITNFLPLHDGTLSYDDHTVAPSCQRSLHFHKKYHSTDCGEMRGTRAQFLENS